MRIFYIANARIPTEKAHGIQIMKMCEAFASYGLPRIDSSDDHRSDQELLYKSLTHQIRGCIFKVYNHLGSGHKESVYQKALEQEFQNVGLKFETQKRLTVEYSGKKVGGYIPDLVVEDKIIIGLKASKFLTKSDKQQTFYYLRGSDYKLALLVNFGSPELQIERLVWFPSKEYNQWKSNRKNQRRSVANGQRLSEAENPRTSEAVNQRISVELAVPTRRNPNFRDVDPFEYYGVERNFKIKKLWTPDPWWLIKLTQGMYIKFQASLFILRLYFYLRRSAFREADNQRESAILYTRDEYLLPILQRVSAGPRSGNNLRRSAPARVVWEAHNMPLNKNYYLKYWQKCFKIIAISQGLKDELVKLGIEENKILVAPDGVDLGKFADLRGFNQRISADKSVKIRKELGLPQDKKIVMYTGHLYEWKGAGTLLEVAKQYGSPPREEGLGEVIESVDTMTPLASPLMRGEKEGGLGPHEGEKKGELLFVFVGGTRSDIKKFKQKAKDLGLSVEIRSSNQRKSEVMILGHKPYSEIPKYLAAADVLVLPNSAKAKISKYYTSPLKLFEYMASGRPIVASDLPSIREILTPSSSPPYQGGERVGVGNSVLVKPDDAQDLASGIKKVLESPDLAERISKQALADVQNYTWTNRAKRILDALPKN